jgi:hypothetical protein
MVDLKLIYFIIFITFFSIFYEILKSIWKLINLEIGGK